LAFIAGVLVVGRLAVQYAGEILSRVPELTKSVRYDVAPSVDAYRPIHVSRESERLVQQLGEAVTAGVPSPDKAVDALLSAKPGDTAVVVAAACLATYVVLRPWVSAFRLKRMLFNVDGDVAALGVSTERWNNTSRSGVFAAEEEAFRNLKTRPPQEFPFDIAVSGLLCVVPVGLGGYLMTRARWEPVWDGFLFWDLTLQLAILFVFMGLVRVAWLVRTWRRRRGSAAPKPPYELQLMNGGRVVARDPIAVALTVYLVPHAFPVWLGLLIRDVRRVQRIRARVSASRHREVIVRTTGVLILSAIAGLMLLQVPVPPLWILVPLDLPVFLASCHPYHCHGCRGSFSSPLRRQQ